MNSFHLSRKGVLFFSVILAILFVFVFIPWAMNVSVLKESKFKNFLGESQILLLRTYEKGEKVLYFVDESARLSLKDTIIGFAQKGMLSKNSCGTVSGYAKWSSPGKDCFPDIENNFFDVFQQNLYNYFSIYPNESIPGIEYEYIIKTENGTEITAKAKKSLRIDVSENELLNFKADVFNAYSVPETPCVPKCDAKECGDDTCGGTCGSCESGMTCNVKGICIKKGEEPPPGGLPTPGQCGYVSDYEREYVDARCLYSMDAAPLASPETCNEYGLTCATFVSSVTSIQLGEATTGNGNQQCDSASVQKIGTDPSVLEPGDIFSSEVYYSGHYTAWGHTGMYQGRGYLVESSKGEGSWCWREYTPDPNGDYIFAHSIGNQNLGLPGVCYDTYEHLFGEGSIFQLISFCRPNKCA